jgi:hypothetical protein
VRRPAVIAVLLSASPALGGHRQRGEGAKTRTAAASETAAETAAAAPHARDKRCSALDEARVSIINTAAERG